jgi:hypothetical protein
VMLAGVGECHGSAPIPVPVFSCGQRRYTVKFAVCDQDDFGFSGTNSASIEAGCHRREEGILDGLGRPGTLIWCRDRNRTVERLPRRGPVSVRFLASMDANMEAKILMLQRYEDNVGIWHHCC